MGIREFAALVHYPLLTRSDKVSNSILTKAVEVLTSPSTNSG